MAKTRAPYAPEFRERLVELARSGRTPEQLSKEFEPTAQSIRNWVCQADLDEGKRTDGTTPSFVGRFVRSTPARSGRTASHAFEPTSSSKKHRSGASEWLG